MGVISLKKDGVVNLKKGDIVSLVKDEVGIKSAIVGLGWDCIERKVSFLAKKKQEICRVAGLLFESPALYARSNNATMDLDAWLLVLDKKPDKVEKVELIYYGNLVYKINDKNIPIRHYGDNLTGEGSGDDEVISIKFDRLGNNINSIYVGVTIYNAKYKHQTLEMVKNMFTRIVDTSDSENRKEIVRFEEKQMKECEGKDGDTFIVGEFSKVDGAWRFEAISKCMKAEDIKEAADKIVNGELENK